MVVGGATPTFPFTGPALAKDELKRRIKRRIANLKDELKDELRAISLLGPIVVPGQGAPSPPNPNKCGLAPLTCTPGPQTWGPGVLHKVPFKQAATKDELQKDELGQKTN